MKEMQREMRESKVNGETGVRDGEHEIVSECDWEIERMNQEESPRGLRA